MGINVKYFEDKDIDEQFICSHCHGVFVDPVLCTCKHVLCWDCFKSRKTHYLGCSVCLKDLKVSSEPLKREWLKKLARLRISCPKGCGEIVTYESYNHHLVEECPFSMVSCTNAGCTKKVRRSDFTEHLTTCAFRSSTCSCGAQLTFIDLRQHELVQRCDSKQNLHRVVQKRREMVRATRDHRINLRQQSFALDIERRQMLNSKQSKDPTVNRSLRTFKTNSSLPPKNIERSSQSSQGLRMTSIQTCCRCGKMYAEKANNERSCSWHVGVS